MEKTGPKGEREGCAPDAPKFLSLERLKAQLRNLKKGTPVRFTSGEPTLNPDLPLLIKEAAKLGFGDITIQTNGRKLCYRHYAEELVNSGAVKFTFSIHGSKPAVHEKITGVPGSFDEAWQGLQNILRLKSANPSVQAGVGATVCKLNANDLGNLLDRFFSIGKLDFVMLNPMIIRGNALRHKEKLALKHSDIIAAVEKYDRKLRKLGLSNVHRAGIIGIPPCIGQGRERKMEKILICDLDKSLPRDVPADRNLGLVKPEKCKTCAYYISCPGIQTAYCDIFGDAELEPVNINRRGRRGLSP